jgi:hypothetical protein
MKRLFLALLLASRAAFACSCLPPPPISEALRSSDFVVHVRCLSFAVVSEHTRVGQFQIIKTFKGESLGLSCSIETGISGASCGYDFIAGNEYLVYGRISEGVLHTSICTRTKWLFLPKNVELEYPALEKMAAAPPEKWREFDLPETDPRDLFK